MGNVVSDSLCGAIYSLLYQPSAHQQIYVKRWTPMFDMAYLLLKLASAMSEDLVKIDEY